MSNTLEIKPELVTYENLQFVKHYDVLQETLTLARQHSTYKQLRFLRAACESVGIILRVESVSNSMTKIHVYRKDWSWSDQVTIYKSSKISNVLDVCNVLESEVKRYGDMEESSDVYNHDIIRAIENQFNKHPMTLGTFNKKKSALIKVLNTLAKELEKINP